MKTENADYGGKNISNNKISSQGITNIDIAVYALYCLGGTEKKVHTEKISEYCYQLAPSQFCWAGGDPIIKATCM